MRKRSVIDFLRKILEQKCHTKKSFIGESLKCNFLVLLGLRIRIANLLLKLITCVLYIFRVVRNPDPIEAAW